MENLEIKNTTQDFINTIFKDIVCDTRGNFVFSPASYLEAIHNLILCVNGENFNEMINVLGIDPSLLSQHIKKYKETLDLESYNILLYANKYKDVINQELLISLKELKTDSDIFGDEKDLVYKVNKIVEEKTHGKIKDLLTEKDVNEFSSAAILNCVYFKKRWENNFDTAWGEEIFYGSEKETNTKFLFNEVRYNYYEDEVMDIVELPYKDSDICCYLFVPNLNHSLFDIINNWSDSYNKINFLKRDIKVNVKVPEFETTSLLPLEKTTQLAGIRNVFNWNTEWNLIDWKKVNYELYVKVDKIIQKAFFKFDKNGTEAAAATYIGITMISGYCGMNYEPPKVKYILADKPFIYVLANKNNKEIPLFIGQVKQI